MQFVDLPEALVQRMSDMRGDEGRSWLARLPRLLDAATRRWSLAIGPVFPGLSYSYVCRATTADGVPAVLKIGMPDPELLTGVEALRVFDGRGAVRLLDADLDLGALLLERLDPGRSLSTVSDDEAATSIAASVMQELWRPAPASGTFPSVADWAAGLGRLRERFGGETGPLPAALVEQAERLFADLPATQGEQVLLHGDLHQDNILSAEREPWLAIDPKGVVGEPAYEVGALLRNYVLDSPDPRATMQRRIAQLAEELGLDRVRIRGWGLAQAVLSAWWSMEDHGRGWESSIACAELLASARE